MELEATGHQMMPMAAMVSSEGHVSPQMPGQPQALNTPLRAPPHPMVTPLQTEPAGAMDHASDAAAPSLALTAETTLAEEVTRAKGDNKAARAVKNKLMDQKDVRIEFIEENPKKKKSGDRYQVYKEAQTIGEYRKLNTEWDQKDLWHDIEHGFVRVLEEGESRRQSSAPEVPLTREQELRMKCALLEQRMQRMAVRPLAHLHELTHEKRRACSWLEEFQSSEGGTVEGSITHSIMNTTCFEAKDYGSDIWQWWLSRCERIIDALSALGYMLDIGITSQSPQERLSAKADYKSKRMIVLFSVAADAKTVVYINKSGEKRESHLASLAERHLQTYAFREHSDNLSNDTGRAGAGLKKGKRNLIYVVYWEPRATRTVRWEIKSKDEQQEQKDSPRMTLNFDSGCDAAAAARRPGGSEPGAPAAKKICTHHSPIV